MKITRPLYLLMFSLLISCQKKVPMVTVHTPDPTPPGGLWLQADIPGQPLLNASPGSAPAQASLRDDKRVHLTARADDSDGGVKEVRIWLTYSRSKPGVTESAGLAGAPVAKDTSTAKVGEQTEVTRSVSYDFTFSDLKKNFETLTLDIWADAENFSSGITTTSHMTIDVQWVDVRLLAIPLTDSNKTSHAATVTAAQFAQLVPKVNWSYEGTGIHFVFDPTKDWLPMFDDDLNLDTANQRAKANAIAQNNPGRIVCLLRWGPDPNNPTGNGNAYPPPGAGPKPPSVQDVTQNYVAFPDNQNGGAFLNLGNGSFMAHELGHYLGLYHTFPGWNATDPVYTGRSVTTANSADQAVIDYIMANGGTVDALDGDLMSDTPPDPSPILYSAHNNQDICRLRTISVIGNILGPGGTQISKTFTFNPDPGNVMGYYGNCIPPGSPAGTPPPPQKFSLQQIMRMNSTLRGPVRDHLMVF